MPKAALVSLATSVPPNVLLQKDVLAAAWDGFGPRFPEFERFSSIFSNTGIIKRHAVKPFDWYLEPRGWPERTEAFLEGAEALFVDVAEKALASAHLTGRDIDTVVTVCSTGIATPSLEARVFGRMGFRSDVARVPVFGLGCAGGASGLSIASRLAQARPGSNVLLVTIELCSLALRHDELTKANIVAVSLFGDGAAAVVLRAGDGGATEVENAGEHLWPDTLGIMGWSVDPEGFGVIFRRTIPDFVRAHLNPAVVRILADMQLTMADIGRFVCHPGGAKVVNALETALALDQGTLDCERQVIADYGNMSSPTILFVLEQVSCKRAAGPLAVDGARPRLYRKLRRAAARRVTSAEFILALVTLQRAAELVHFQPQHQQAQGTRRIRGGATTLSLDRRGACGLADIALDFRTRSARERRCLAALRRPAGFSYLGDADTRRALDDADHHSAGRAAWSGADPIGCCRTPITPWWPARSRCCPSFSAFRWLALIFTVLNAAVLAIRIRAENRALAVSPAMMARGA